LEGLKSEEKIIRLTVNRKKIFKKKKSHQLFKIQVRSKPSMKCSAFDFFKAVCPTEPNCRKIPSALQIPITALIPS